MSCATGSGSGWSDASSSSRASSPARPTPTPTGRHAARLGRAGRSRSPARPAGAGRGRLRRGHDRHHARLLPGGAGGARHGRRSRSGDGVRRGRLRSARGGARRPLRAAIRPPRQGGRGPNHPGRGAADRAGRGVQPDGQARARATSPATARRRCATGWPGWCETSSSSESGGSAIMTYDDLLTRLNDILAGPNGPAARERLRSRYDVVLVDEFQDTDPIQWQILYRAFATGGVTLVLVADPKQAIYAFRGAEVYAYLKAAEIADARATLRVNRRSDQPLLDAFDALFDDARLGHENIVYRQVRAALRPPDERGCPARRPTPRSASASCTAAEPTVEQTNYGYARAPSAREHVARDLAADVVRLLDSGARLEHRDAGGEPIGEEPICPRAHRRARSHPRQCRAGLRPAATARECPRSSTAAATCSRTAARPRLAAPARGARAPSLDDPRQDRRGDALPRLERRADRHRGGGGMGGGAPAPAPLEPDPPRQRRRSAHRGDHGRRGPRRADARRDGGRTAR